MTGPTGPAGPTGATGATGATGSSGAVGAKAALVSTAVATSSTSYTDLTNSIGPAVAVTVPASGAVLVTITGGILSSYNGEMGAMGFALTGTNISSATDARALRWTGRNELETFQSSATFYISGLTAGSTTFTAKYKTETGGSKNTTFSNRNIIVIPLP